MSRRWSREELRARAREVAAQAPPFTPAQIRNLRRILGIDTAPAPFGAPLTAPMCTRPVGAPPPTAATTNNPGYEVSDHDDTSDVSADAA
ncbi:hypothetical protein [Frankia canadensis]|uniref:hypothetical protein n=1 Tax=Frankia canadensis TaxID=1836972 RepID=UPI000C7AEA9A|nr:hypothetical protein [Frankia canadensis]